MTTTTPGSVPGFVGRTTGTTQDLEGLSFPVACPPDIGPKTRLVAVCGCTDEEGQASPEKDGWFLSDFYLFHHLFSRTEGPTPAQIWMTCEEPEDLVHKYTEYAHRDPKEERKVVLDKSMLPKIQQSGSLRVVSRRDLLERFLSTLREQSREAQNNNEHLLVMILGHGDDETFGVALGGNEPNLRMEDVKRALQPNTPTALFMTSCFSGSWLVQPDTNISRHMNVSGMTGAGPEAQSTSWPLSASLRRARGSRITSAILRSTIAIEESQETEATSQIRQDPTYWAFSNSIYDTYRRLDSFAEETQIHFSAQDDQWELHFKRRSGMTLSQLKTRWESLRSIPQGDYEAPLSSGSGTGTMRFGTIRKRSKLKYLARLYLSANPGLDNEANNIALHSGLGGYLRGKSNSSDKEVERMLEEVICRLDSLKQAEDLVAVMIQERVNKAVDFKNEESRNLTALFGSQTTRDAEVARHRDIVLDKFRALKVKASGVFRG
ncbi:hypothetical protein UA08_08591 [Talaromyces atroroseus]|uniref:Uncharacterized protein n=1 Tax=Talaromyces atroroseus TaxID=1441469 RepID=A0A225A6N7_TALAT|nr:hypothetical protein UA08_08591 [Talaromyces atroroseus]OKL56072.1 hypothetical protein UA08_08591 [Talaromyces atroroseus]